MLYKIEGKGKVIEAFAFAIFKRIVINFSLSVHFRQPLG